MKRTGKYEFKYTKKAQITKAESLAVGKVYKAIFLLIPGLAETTLNTSGFSTEHSPHFRISASAIPKRGKRLRDERERQRDFYSSVRDHDVIF